MRGSSPILQAFKAPLKGMDAREVRQPDSPNLLYNIDMSTDGVWTERPGVYGIYDFTASVEGVNSTAKIMGLQVVRVNSRLNVVVLIADTTNKQMYVSVIAGNGMAVVAPFNITQPTDLDIPAEPYSDRHYYNFSRAGRFLYFCNGFGNFFEMEFRSTVGSIKLRSLSFAPEQGLAPSVMSYIQGSLQPTSLDHFFEQLVTSGFRQNSLMPLSNPLHENQNVVPADLLAATQTVMTADSGTILVSEPLLWRSFPVEDPGGLYWVFDDDVVATAGVGTTLIVFTKRSIYRIVGHGSQTPQRVWMADASLVSSRSWCHMLGGIFFVAHDGCYIIIGDTAKKVSWEMDPLWFSRQRPETTRDIQGKLRDTAYPFFVNLEALDEAFCVNDRKREQIMVALPHSGTRSNSMVWVWNYGDLVDGTGTGKWSIWSGNQEPDHAGSASGPINYSAHGSSGACAAAGGVWKDFPGSVTDVCTAPAPTLRQPTSNMMHWTAGDVDYFQGDQTVYVGTDQGQVLILGGNIKDTRRNGGSTPTHTALGMQVVIGLGRVGRVDFDGRMVLTDVAVRRLAKLKNYPDDPNASRMSVYVRSEGEGQKLFGAELDFEFTTQLDNMPVGVSENTTSTLGSTGTDLTLGTIANGGTNTPTIRPEYMESFARVNLPDEDGRAAIVDIYGLVVSGPLHCHISEVRIHGNVKGGSQRQS